MMSATAQPLKKSGPPNTPLIKPIIWRPQAGPQAAFVQCPVFEVCYGGARGGGKTDAALGEWAVHAKRYGADAKGLFVRRTLIALGPTIERAKRIYKPLGAVWQEQKSRFVWPNGAILYFRYLERDADADNYQGHDYTRVYVEELTQFPDPGPLDKLKATLRSAAGVPTGFRATCNPGGPGHTWVKDRYIDAGAYRIVKETFTNPFNGQEIESSRVFIPAKLSDNPELLNNDPRYVANLFKAGSAALVKAWLEGDWDVVEGAFFDCWQSAKHVVSPFPIPKGWIKFRSFDWGSAAPFSVGWWAVASDDYRGIPRGALVRYREWYGASAPGKGLKLTTEEVARGILSRDDGETFAYSVADPAIFAEDGGPSRAEIFGRHQVYFKRADNKRVTGNGAMGGWDEMRQRLKGKGETPANVPMLYVFDTCRDFIRTVPSLPHDPNRPEDIDTSAEDHVADEARYACMSRPWTPEARPKEKPRRDRYGSDDDDGDDSWKVV
jgi:hypothetical protein